MNNLYSFYWDCGRQGDLEGLFIATQAEVDAAIGKELDFGECLGKHSDIRGTLEANEIKLMSSDTDKVEWLLNLLGYNVSGFNPLDAVVVHCDACGNRLWDGEECCCQEHEEN